MENSKLSDKLKLFKESYESNNPETVANCQIPETLNKISGGLQEAISNFKLSGNDSQINSIVANVELAKDGVERIKAHIDSDIPAVLAQLKSVHESIAKIEENVKKLGEKESQLSGIIGSTILDADSRKEALNREIKALKDEIEAGNTKAESQLDGIASALDGVDFGVKGNMKAGGTLGAGSSYDFSLDGGSEDGSEGEKKPDSETRDSFADANEFDTITLSAHKGKSNVICIPRNMREMKDAMHAGQPFILEKGSIFQYDAHGLNFDYYDATKGRRYFVKCDDGFYREVDESGKLVNNQGTRIDPIRVFASGDYSEQTGTGWSWINDTGLKYDGPPREAAPAPEKTGTEQTDIQKVNVGDSYVGTYTNGKKVHNGSSDVVAEPKNMVEFKKAVKNGQPIKLDGVKFIYDNGGWSVRDEYDATKKPIYLVQDDEGYYAEVGSSGNKVRGAWRIDPKRVAEAADNGEFEWDNEWWNPFSWGLDDTVFENWEGGKKQNP